MLVTTTNDGTPELAPTGMDRPLCATPARRCPPRRWPAGPCAAGACAGSPFQQPASPLPQRRPCPPRPVLRA
ncbi:MAG: hypothetical protein U1E74_08270 [Paenacidovorax caeni]